MRIRLLNKDVHLHVDRDKKSRISFIFANQVETVEGAYDMLSSMDAE